MKERWPSIFVGVAGGWGDHHLPQILHKHYPKKYLASKHSVILYLRIPMKYQDMSGFAIYNLLCLPLIFLAETRNSSFPYYIKMIIYKW